ncbi:MAG: hypothetical protein IT426_13700 [Pirellulales bacterium]|nr:hypothetical protein [Pirellulales bacterium]
MTNNTPQLRTPGIIASELNVPLRRVLYVLQKRDDIKPIGRAGCLRLYDRQAVILVEDELRKMSQKEAQP